MRECVHEKQRERERERERERDDSREGGKSDSEIRDRKSVV